jgi:hypothetical protein
LSMALFFQGRDRVFARATPETLGLFSVFRWLCSSRGETEFFPYAAPEKLGLFSAYRWLCSFRGETEFFSPSPHPKNSVSFLLFDDSVLSGERPSFFSDGKYHAAWFYFFRNL